MAMLDVAATTSGPVAAEELARRRARLLPTLPTDRLAGWVWPLVVTAVAALMRFWGLGSPRSLVFDEVYYEHDSFSLLHHGVEVASNDKGPGFVVHPPLGKWMLAVGEWLFDHNHSRVVQGGTFPTSQFSARFMAAVVGSLAVLILARTARRMTGSTLLGCVAGLLLAFDGLEFVHSRIALLDIFLMFWVVAAFACLVADRDDGRRRLADRLAEVGAGSGPFLGVRWWRLATGACLGAALATKWSAIYYLPAFVVLAFLWDWGARRAAGHRRPLLAAVGLDWTYGVGTYVVLPAVVYFLSWIGWFLGDANAFDHDRYVRAGQRWLGLRWLGHFRALVDGWWHYQFQIKSFHTGLNSGHPYRSEPLGWLVLARPVAYFYQSPKTGCGHATACSREILGIGNPVIWWAAIPALIAMIWLLVSRGDWRAGAVLAGFLAGWLPWLLTVHRTKFLFYALPTVPFMALALTVCVGWVLGSRWASEKRRVWGAIVAGGYLLSVVAVFFYFYPVLVGRTIPYNSWYNHMWFRNCGHSGTTHENAPCWI